MLARRLSQIVQLPQRERFAVLAEGLRLLADNVAVLDTDFTQLAEQRRDRGAAVLQGFADEEAAKVMILLDIARCGWRDHATVKRCLWNFYQHLSRGLYVRAYDGNPADLSEVRDYIDALRQQYRLDGPLDVDWIFGNEVLTGREERLYVDWIEDEDGERRWTGPALASAIEDEPFDFPPPRSGIVEVVKALNRLGMLTEEGLESTRSAWDGITVEDTMRWEEVFELNADAFARLAQETNREYQVEEAEELRFAFEHWTFPLYNLDLTEAKVDLETLRQERSHRLAYEFGFVDDSGYPQ